MERTTTIDEAREIMGANFVGPDELRRLAPEMRIKPPTECGPIPEVPFGADLLRRFAEGYLLILGTPDDSNNHPLTINSMRNFFGTDPAVKQPCFYNQDWYLNEEFACNFTPGLSWHLLRKQADDGLRGTDPESFVSSLSSERLLPRAVVASFSFFTYYFLTGGKMLWEHEFVWCSDTDHNGDRIYVGRYSDPSGINKSGFNIHRHLRLTSAYTFIDEISPGF